MSGYSQAIAEAGPQRRAVADGARVSAAMDHAADGARVSAAMDHAADGARVSAVASFMLPSLGAAIFVVALLHVLFISEGTRVLFRDSDAGWHIIAGESIVAGGGIPAADPWSYTRPGAPWFAWEWLSDVLLGGAHRLGGLPAVAMLGALVIAAAAWGSARLSLALGGNFFFTAAATVLLMGVSSIHWLARPHMFSWLLALAFVAVAEIERTKATRALFLLPALACLWANVHGSFPLGIAILAFYAAGEMIAGRSGLRLASAALAALLATFLNPYGWKVHAHIFAYLRNTYLMDRISEFRSFSFHGPGALYVELFLLVAVAGGLALLLQRAWGPALLTFAMLHMALYSARHLPTAAVVLLPLAVAALTREAERLPRLRSFLAYSQRLALIDKRISGALPVLLALLLAAAGVAALDRAGRVGFDPSRFPAGAAQYLEQRGLEGRVFAKDQWGGYLIYRFGGRLKVFVDGRSDFYGIDHLERYAQVVEVKPGWDAVLSQEKVRFVLAPPEHVLGSALRLSRDWKAVYADSVAVVFERTA